MIIFITQIEQITQILGLNLHNQLNQRELIKRKVLFKKIDILKEQRWRQVADEA
ncbi:hypothetical protein [Chryseobacterium terrae]|uniref:Uncharacterized protein n=1 Tax=Chryseobacterium terrae TaxID=3163299 RepID=A0ABW8XYM7_9FLAO